MVLADLSLRPEAQELVDRHSSKDTSPRAIFVLTDVTEWPQLDNLFLKTLDEFNGFDIVCPGAGVYEPEWSNFWLPPGSEQSRDDPSGGRYAEIDINLNHPVRVTQIAMSHWLHPQARNGGERPAPASLSNPKRIVHIGSVASQAPVFRAPLYGATKFAISGFVRSLADLEPLYGIRVNAVAPGVVKTPLWTEHPDKLANIDLNKDAWVTPLEVAETMLICVESGSKIGGTFVEVGAGRTRVVPAYNAPGPDFSPQAGLITSNGDVGVNEVKGWLQNESVWGPRGQARDPGY